MVRIAALALTAVALMLGGSACGEDVATRPAGGVPAGASNADASSAARAASRAASVPAAPPASNAAAVEALAPLTARPDTTLAAPDSVTAQTFRSIVAAARQQGIAERSYGEIVQWVGAQLLGRPYVAGMLDAPAEETLVVDLRSFDCVLFIENVLAIARGIALDDPSYTAYARGVEALRYREGTENGYCSRLHYFSDWIASNEHRGTLRNVTAEAGGERFDKTLDFMSTHRESYPKLASDAVYACIVDTEAQLAGTTLYYIPQDRIAQAYGSLQAGDIIATATSIGGLDVTHTGFVHKTPTQTGFMHASLSSNAVKVSPDLQSYVQGIRSQVGVVVARPLDPRGADRTRTATGG